MTTSDGDVLEHWYGIRVLIKHPDIDPAIITKQLGITPTRFWRAGEARRTPKGSPLSGCYPDSYWGYAITVDDKPNVFDGVEKILNTLEPHAPFISALSASGGNIQIVLSLDGNESTGDTLSAENIARMAAMSIDFGLEVYPPANQD